MESGGGPRDCPPGNGHPPSRNGKRSEVDTESVTVTIFGREYTLRGDADPDYVKKVADFVDQRMSEVAKGSAVASTAKVAILAAVNIADELFREQQKRLENMASVDDQSVQLARLLAREVGGDPNCEDGGESLPGT